MMLLLSQPFILARMQPLLQPESRATYLSVQSLVGRLAFAGSLLIASRIADPSDALTSGQISTILGSYAAAGLACFSILALCARQIAIEPEDGTSA